MPERETEWRKRERKKRFTTLIRGQASMVNAKIEGCLASLSRLHENIDQQPAVSCGENGLTEEQTEREKVKRGERERPCCAAVTMRSWYSCGGFERRYLMQKTGKGRWRGQNERLGVMETVEKAGRKKGWMIRNCPSSTYYWQSLKRTPLNQCCHLPLFVKTNIYHIILERSSLHEGRAGDLFHRKWNVTTPA